MDPSFLALSIFLAAWFACVGMAKVVNYSCPRNGVIGNKIGTTPNRMVGLGQVVIAIGFLAGMEIRPLSVISGTAACALMFQAVGYHVGLRDGVATLITPAAIAVAALWLTVAAL